MGRFGLKIAMCLIFMKFGNQNRMNILIMKILIGIDDLDQKLEILHLKQIEHVDYELIMNSN